MNDPQHGTRDPRLSDFRGSRDPAVAERNLDPINLDPMEEAPVRRGGSAVWAWLAGFVAAAFIVAIVYGFGNPGAKDVALDRNAPAATTGSSSGPPPPDR
jgi:hypothetical protein